MPLSLIDVLNECTSFGWQVGISDKAFDESVEYCDGYSRLTCALMENSLVLNGWRYPITVTLRNLCD